MRKYRVIIENQQDVYITSTVEPSYQGCRLYIHSGLVRSDFEFWNKIISVEEVL